MTGKKKAFYVCLSAFIVLITGLAGAEEQADELTGAPDPAAVYAVKLGYKYEIREECGIVIFPDGTESEGWDFFRGKAGQKWSYCEQHGGKIENRIEDMGTWTADYAVCVFSDGSECREADYIDGECGPGVYKNDGQP